MTTITELAERYDMIGELDAHLVRSVQRNYEEWQAGHRRGLVASSWLHAQACQDDDRLPSSLWIALTALEILGNPNLDPAQ